MRKGRLVKNVVLTAMLAAALCVTTVSADAAAVGKHDCQQENTVNVTESDGIQTAGESESASSSMDKINITQQDLQDTVVIVKCSEDDKVVLFDLNTSYQEALKSLNSTNATTDWKYKTKNVYSKATGKQVATFTIQYSTEMSGGRPIFKEVGIDLQFINYYRGAYECTEARGDLVTFKVSYNLFGIDQGYVFVSFMP